MRKIAIILGLMFVTGTALAAGPGVYDFVGRADQFSEPYHGVGPGDEITGSFEWVDNVPLVEESRVSYAAVQNIVVHIGDQTLTMPSWFWQAAPGGAGMGNVPIYNDTPGHEVNAEMDINLEGNANVGGTLKDSNPDGQYEKRSWWIGLYENVGDALYKYSNMTGDIISVVLRQTPGAGQVVDSGSGASNGTIKDGYGAGTDR